jgi:hypothetical protein
MKRLIALIMTGILISLALMGCSEASSPLKDAGFKEAKTGEFTYLDTKNSPFPQSGLNIAVVQGSNGYVKFVVTDTTGKDTADYYQFSPADSTMLRHRYVSAMGSTYNYHFNYKDMTLTKVTDGKDADVTATLKQSGRWESGATETKEHAQKLMDYFKTNYKLSIEEAVASK